MFIIRKLIQYFSESIAAIPTDTTINMTLPMQRMVVKHNTIANRTFTQ